MNPNILFIALIIPLVQKNAWKNAVHVQVLSAKNWIANFMYTNWGLMAKVSL